MLSNTWKNKHSLKDVADKHPGGGVRSPPKSDASSFRPVKMENDGPTDLIRLREMNPVLVFVTSFFFAAQERLTLNL